MKIVVYDSSPDFGGHQVMACHGIAALAATPTVEVLFMFNPANRKLAGKRPTLGSIQTMEADIAAFQTLEPDLILCIQGDIAQSAEGVVAATKAGIECVSYLAIPHRLADMGAKLGALRDLRNKPLFNRPDRFITLSESMKHIMRARGCTQPIHIVPNGILAPPRKKITPHGSRLTLGLIGRIEFKQKQQDFMVRTFLQNPEFKNSRLLIIGNGPDEAKLKKMISSSGKITFLPWQENMDAIYEQIDLLVIPSRYEGVPLVMLEALARGIPTLGSARDGMKDLLPKTWTFDPENSQALATAFSNIRKNGAPQISTLQKKVLTEHSLEAFRTHFVKAVIR